MRHFTPLLLIFSFLLAACGQPRTAVPVVHTEQPVTATTTLVPPEPTATEPALPTPLPPIDHVTVFLAEQAFFEKLADDRGFHGVYVHELGSPDTATFNPDVQFHGASTIKLAIAVVTLKVAQERGWPIEEMIPNPRVQSKTIASLLRDMIVRHDDASTFFLIDFINGLGFNFDDELLKMGLLGFNVGNRLTTARGLGLLLEGLGNDSLGLFKNQFLVDLMAEDSIIDTATFPWAVNNSLPGSYANIVGAIYGHDVTVPFYGNIKYVAADCGYWTTPEGRTFIVVFLGNYGTETDFVLNQNTIHDEVAILTQYFSK